MSVESLKDAVKVLDTTFAEPHVPYPLPDELQHTIEAFLDADHELDQDDSQALHDALLACYNDHVRESSAKLTPFLGVIRQLRPAIKGDPRLAEWWDLVIRPTIDSCGNKRTEIEDAREFLLGVLTAETDEGKDPEGARAAVAFRERLLDCFIYRTRLPTDDDDCVTSEDEFIARQLEDVIVEFGRRKPKDFMIAVDGLFVQRKYRAQALSLLSTFVRIQPPHLWVVLETRLLQNLERCLMLDTSATVLELALTVLIMFIPHITSSIISRLPKLFLIYSRILCWEKAKPVPPEEMQSPSSPTLEAEEDADISDDEADGPAWEKLENTFDHPESGAPVITYYFTFLYGLFPLNFMSYIRKPRKWLKSVNYLGADDVILDQQVISQRTEPIRRVHLLHPNFFTTTVEDEMSESRWLKSEPADLVTECMGLCMEIPEGLEDPGPPPTAKLPDIPEALVPTDEIPAESLALDDDVTLANSTSSPMESKSSNTWRNTQSTTLTNASKESVNILRKASLPASRTASPAMRALDSVLDSPTLPGQDRIPPTSRSRRDSRKGSDASAALNSLGSPRLEAFTQALSRNQTTSNPAQPQTQDRFVQNLATLQREVMLLRNDLNFERYLKHQHLSHIGQLQRRHLKEATVESETQKLINTNRVLKAKLQKADEIYAQLKKETTTSRNLAKKWESDLVAKIKVLRDEQKLSRSEGDSMREELAQAQDEIKQLRRVLDQTKGREQRAKDNLTTSQRDIDNMATLRQEVESLQERLREWELRELEFEHGKEELDRMRGKMKMVSMKLDSRDYEREAMSRMYQKRIAELEKQKTQAPLNPNHLPPPVQQMIESTLAAHNSKLQALKKTHTRLLHRYTEVEMRCQELEAELKHPRNHGHLYNNGDLSFHHGNGNGNGNASPLAPISPVETTSSASANRHNSMTAGSVASSVRNPNTYNNPINSTSFASRFAARAYSEPPTAADITKNNNNNGGSFTSATSPTATDDLDYADFSSYPSYPGGSMVAPSQSFPRSNSSFHHQLYQHRGFPPPPHHHHPPSTAVSEPRSPVDGVDLVSPYEGGSGGGAARFHAFNANATEPLDSSGMSSFSGDTGGSGPGTGDGNGSFGSGRSGEGKAKIGTKDGVRYYGRGGAQNIGKKKEKDRDGQSGASSSSKPAGSGGFRGFKGLMSPN